LEFIRLSHDWILQLVDPTSQRICSVFGYTFDLNPAAAVDICREKAATSLVLERHSIPHIAHTVYLSPANPSTADYVPRKGNWGEVQSLIAAWGFPVVIKPLKGTGGVDVIKASCWREVEGAVQHIFSKEYGLAISPYKQVIDEYRCFVLDGEIELVYRKVRAHVIGDGTSPMSALAGKALMEAAPKDALQLASGLASMSADELAKVPGDGEQVPVQWKHNLGQGASADLDVSDEFKKPLTELAKKASGAIGMRFCSVDIVNVEGEGLVVMEVNAGVMMDSLVTQRGEEGSKIATRIYEFAVLKCLGRV